MKAQLFIFPTRWALFRLLFILAGLVFVLSSCAAVQVSEDYDTGYQFGKEHTFGWNEQQQQANNRLGERNELLANRFRMAIEAGLAKRGFGHDPHPAFLVSYIYTVSSRVEVDPGYSNFGFGYGYFGRHGFYHGAELDMGDYARQYDQGKLIIEIQSAKTGHLLWRGTGTREVYTHSSPDEITRRVAEMVEAVLAQFPPP
jgi:Domain of unknown function (DUF4136)